MSDEGLRVLALAAAIECEGPKAMTAEVLDAADAIYLFLKGRYNDEAEVEPRPN